MAINVSVQDNGGFLPDIILLTQGYIPPSGNPSKYHERGIVVVAAHETTTLYTAHVVESP